MESVSFEDAIRSAISIGGDSDTIAAIAGALAEAHHHGVSGELRNEALSCLDKALLSIFKEWEEFYGSIPNAVIYKFYI